MSHPLRDPDSPLRRVLRNIGWLLASRGGGALLSLVYLGLATRALGLEGFGRFALIMASAQAVATFAGFQTWQIVVKYGVAHQAAGDKRGMAALLKTCIGLDLISMTVGIGLQAAIMFAFAEAFGLTPELRNQAILFGAVLLLALRSTPLGLLRLHDRYVAAAFADMAMPVVRVVGAALAYLFSPTIGAFLATWAAAEFANALAYWWVASRTGELREMVRMSPPLSQMRAANPGIVRFALTTNAGSTVALASKQIPVIAVGLAIGPAAAGVFRLAQQVSNAVSKFSLLMARAALGEMARADGRARATLTRDLTRLTVIASAIVFALLLVLGRPIVDAVGGEGYQAAYALILVLGLAACIDLSSAAFDPALMASDRAGMALRRRLAGAIVIIALQFALLPLIGTAGAAWATLAGSLVTAVLLAHAVRRSSAR